MIEVGDARIQGLAAVNDAGRNQEEPKRNADIVSSKAVDTDPAGVLAQSRRIGAVKLEFSGDINGLESG